jgi:hypothetical protein
MPLAAKLVSNLPFGLELRERHVEDRGAAGSADDDDPAGRVDGQVLAEVVSAAEVRLSLNTPVEAPGSVRG